MYDCDFKYGQNFYVALTEEAKEKLLNVSTFGLGAVKTYLMSKENEC